MKCLCKVDGIVMVIENSILLVCLLLDLIVVGDFFYEYLDGIGCLVVCVFQYVCVINVFVFDVVLVGIVLGIVMLLMIWIGYFEDNILIELIDIYCCNDYYDFVVEL